MDERIVMIADNYDRIDGENAYQSDIKQLTLGVVPTGGNKKNKIMLQIHKEQPDGSLKVDVELPIHQVLDMAIFLSRTMLYFKEAYRMPLLYQPEKPVVERIGVQGDAMSVAVCTDNPQINNDIQDFLQAINDCGELTGERLRILTQIVEELKKY